MFERAPFHACPSCGADGQFGILTAGDDWMKRRCRVCRHSAGVPLPPVEKRVVYLDQFAISELYKVKSGTRRKGANSEVFWGRLEKAVSRAVCSSG